MNKDKSIFIKMFMIDILLHINSSATSIKSSLWAWAHSTVLYLSWSVQFESTLYSKHYIKLKKNIGYIVTEAN